MKLLILYTCVFVICFSGASAQTLDATQRFQLAQQYEEAQQWETALTIYEELYRSSQQNFLYFQGLQRCYIQLKRYSDAITITHLWLQHHPNEIAIKITLAGLYYDAGEPKKADSLWSAILVDAGTNVAVHRLVAQEMLQHRLYDNAIETYRKARTISKNPTLYADELAILYFSLQQYEHGAEEYIRVLTQRPDNLSFVQSRLSSYASRPEAIRRVQKTIKQALQEYPSHLTLYRLALWVHIQLKQYFDAIEIAKQVDYLGKSPGNELFQLAQRFTQENNFLAASYAYAEYIRQFPTQPHALFGFAYALHELCKQRDTIIVEPRSILESDIPSINLPYEVTFHNALQWYREVLKHAPSLDLVAHTWFRIGMLYFDHLENLDSALTAFTMVVTFQRNTNLYFDAVQKLGEVYTSKGALSEARACFGLSAYSPNETTRQLGQYFLACVEYYQGYFDSARTLLDPLTSKLATTIANDALALKLFIEENQTAAPQALAEFARAEYLTQQRKYSEAIELYRTIIRRYPSAPLIDDAYINLGQLYMKQWHFHDALTTFRIVTDSLPLSIWKDKALWYIGLIYERGLHQTLQAIKTYEELLTRFPNSLFAENSRKRIRFLRGDDRKLQ
ncbi:MAG: tetratricopeptide repeat protein [Bacteroidetes bacterium]|nr:tetratricopeptide repeat protein [Bacteroidota bacterium]